MAMGISLSKSKSISGIALISAIVAGCGGGGGGTPAAGGGSPPANLTVGSTVCKAVQNPEVLTTPNGGALLGSCEQFEASTSPTRAATAFKTPGTSSPLVYNSVSGYTISFPILVAGSASILLTDVVTPAGGGTGYRFGNLAGKTYQSDINKSTGAAAIAYDYVNTTNAVGGKVLDLRYSRFGMFSRFEDRTQGYYGGWAQGGNTTGSLPAGSVSFRGAIVGVLGPASTNTSNTTAVGFSADVIATVNFSVTGAPITSLTLSNFGYTSNGTQFQSGTTQVVVPLAAGGAVTSSTLDVGTKSISASFNTPAAAGNSAISAGLLSGSFFGDGVEVSELVGTLKFNTADGRNAVGAFGVRSGASIVNP
jgi:hypothetical protein